MKGKRRIGVIAGIVMIAGIWKYQSLPEYKVINSFVLSGGSYRESELKVIAYKDYLVPKLEEKVREEYHRINGTCDRLVIKLYFSEHSYKVGKPYRVAVFDYDVL